jgi:hypothetical protein
VALCFGRMSFIATGAASGHQRESIRVDRAPIWSGASSDVPCVPSADAWSVSVRGTTSVYWVRKSVLVSLCSIKWLDIDLGAKKSCMLAGHDA